MTGLLSSWSVCCAANQLDATRCVVVGRELLQRWREPHRRYHTVKHLTECLQIWQNVEAHWQQPWLAGMALWYHDAIYDPLAQDNEASSAALASCDLSALGMPPDTVDRITDLILATDHRHVSHDPDALLLNDIDLSILGTQAERYDRYVSDIRQEYAQVDDTAWRLGRSRVLRRFLDRERIFSHAAWSEHEEQARSNLTRELGLLSLA